ncbi:uncharacterized protein [Acropora muricata]|uniref:uncharacterized protein isoform X3 n=1 Tax=Acropora muricata TaxID=159855 RepID=UPI0034E424AF
MSYIALICRLLIGILAFCSLSDGASLTWNEPPPLLVVQALKDPATHFSSRQLFEGTINATLSWHFGLTELLFQALAISFEGNTVACISSSVNGTRPGYANRYGLEWNPNKKLVKLFIFNVSMEDNGTFSCRVVADSLDRYSAYQFTSNVQVDVVGTTSTPSTTYSTIDEKEGTTSTPSTTYSTIDEEEGTTSTPSTTSSIIDEEQGSAGTLWAIMGGLTGGVVLAIGVCVLTWCLHKRRECRTDTKIHSSDQDRRDVEGGHLQVEGAYAQSGPPAANGTDSAAEQQIEAEAAIPTYAAVDKSKKSKKQADERPPEDAVVEKSQKKEKQEAAAIPTYAAVDKSKKKKKSREEVPAVYAKVDKSKKKKKKKIDDKNLYENLDEPEKEKKPGELLYADLGDFQNPGMPAVSISPQPLRAIKKADPFERTDYTDITQFLKRNATLPPNVGNGDAEMKPKRPSKKKEIQGNDKETPI